MSRQEILLWHDPQDMLPDIDTTVLIQQPDGHEPVELGYYDGTEWLNVYAWGTSVIAWAYLPKGVAP